VVDDSLPKYAPAGGNRPATAVQTFMVRQNLFTDSTDTDLQIQIQIRILARRYRHFGFLTQLWDLHASQLKLFEECLDFGDLPQFRLMD
jgi:hypothetical protein